MPKEQCGRIFFWKCNYYSKIKCNAQVRILGEVVLKKLENRPISQIKIIKLYNKVRENAISD